MSENKSLLYELKSLKKEFELGKLMVPALRNVSLEIKPGEIIALQSNDFSRFNFKRDVAQSRDHEFAQFKFFFETFKFIKKGFVFTHTLRPNALTMFILAILKAG